MKKIDKTIFLYIIAGLAIMTAQLLVSIYIPKYNRLINLIIWGIIFTFLQFQNIDLQRYNNLREKIIYVILIMIGYYIAYFSLGFFYGYSNNPYSQQTTAILENIIFMIGLILLQEYIRYKLLNYKKNIFIYIIVTLFFVLFSVEILNIPYYFRNAEAGLEYVFGELVILIIYSCISTYLALRGGIKLLLTYAIISKIGIIFMPIIPKLNWFVECVLELVTALIIFLVVRYLNTYRNKNVEKREIVKLNPFKMLPIIIVLTIFTLFVAGVLPYRPVAVMSNSMVPVFSRGDIIIIKSINQEDIKYLEEGQIIEYKVPSGSSVVHRIQRINTIGDSLNFITKGDNNISADTEKVQENQIKGVVTMTIPYIGFPSVYFSQFILNVNPTIDT